MIKHARKGGGTRSKSETQSAYSIWSVHRAERDREGEMMEHGEERALTWRCSQEPTLTHSHHFLSSDNVRGLRDALCSIMWCYRAALIGQYVPLKMVMVTADISRAVRSREENLKWDVLRRILGLPRALVLKGAPLCSLEVRHRRRVRW